MKKKVFVGMGAVAAVLLSLICFCIWFLSGAGTTDYYTQIDNSKIERVDSREGVVDLRGGMPYSYTLRSYDENGKEKDVSFGTERELKDGAFARLTVMPVRGVLEWSEMEYEELPAAVQKKYAYKLQKAQN